MRKCEVNNPNANAATNTQEKEKKKKTGRGIKCVRTCHVHRREGMMDY